ncbi:ribosomal protein L3 [Heterostelium album PN500]|uniref:Large ribosomal subunit protein uL3m n=1 Tax=Heterostelium pallidum (strain ATCC 26659 / Pp 5 / PN500) TaxID=670386 RepID=D3AXK2_HETP5|nr:ribosomal protein L3 [Heterostelium album PN500]EFA86271.1 ribosomal protein L3 [Heterostelium album PN500]|eukprot:XP_020438376.1 ribosomal protein L3 [Heterostelium album PN500]
MSFLSRLSIFTGSQKITLVAQTRGLAGSFYIPKPAFGQKPPEPPFLRDKENGWTKQTHRVGAIGKKVGMTTVWVDHVAIPVTVVHLPNNQVVQVKHKVNDGVDALQVGADEIRLKNVKGTMKGHFAKADVPPKRILMEFPVTRNAFLPVGTQITPRHFVPGQLVTIKGVSTGKGFQGGMKRWNFSGLAATHGVSVSHRSIGSTGCRQTPGRVFKGKKMPGHLGSESTTVLNLQVIQCNTELGTIMLKGAVPGKKGSYIRIIDSRSNKWTKSPPFPTHMSQPGDLDVELTITNTVPTERNGALDVSTKELPLKVHPLLLKQEAQQQEQQQQQQQQVISQ